MNAKEKQTATTFSTNKVQSVFYRNWKVNLKPKAIVLIVHGLNSHSGYYQHFALQLNENNYEVYAMDLRGRGHSDGERYYVADYKDIVGDIDLVVQTARAAHPTLPIFLFGHSAGGVFASVYAVEHQHQLKGLIAESFAFQLPAPAFALAVITFLGYIIPHVRLVKLNNQDFSREKSVVAAMNNDPLLAHERQPAKTMQQLLRAAAWLKKKMPDITLPLLILHGTADKATQPGGSNYFMEHAASTDKQLKLYEGHFHDLLNDKDNAIVVRDIIQWLNAQVEAS
jgi:alpha-beta hydrolase superfamily lysophospholipase